MYPPDELAADMSTDEPADRSQVAPQRRPAGSLLDLSDAEQTRILDHITGAYSDAWQDNDQRIARFRRHFRSWRNKIGMGGGLVGKSNFRVPLIVEKVLVKWAKTLDALLGDDAEIVAQPTGPVDRMIAEKVGRYMTWQVFNHMDIIEELAKFIFQEIIFGRAHAELYYDLRWLYGPGGAKGELLYDGPRFKTIPMDCFIVPPSAGESTPQDFAWVCTREWKTLDQLLTDEAEGYVTGVTANAEAIWRHARQAERHDETTDQLRREMAGFEGVVSDYAATTKSVVEVRKHYGRWRMLAGRRDVEYDNFDARDVRETEIVVQYIPDLNVANSATGAGLFLGARDLAELYPHTPNRRPIVGASFLKDGSYWPPGIPEMLEEIEVEMSVNHNLMNEAGERMVSPPGFYIPGMGVGEERQKLEPGMLYPTPDPKSVYFADTKGDVNFCVVRNQLLTTIAEGVSGLPASTTGRYDDRPNQPKTFRGQALALGQSDLRQSLELIFMTEDWSKILDQIKMLVDEYGPPEEEFRVTESASSGFLESHATKGFATITARERQGKYDFKLRFATSAQSREARKEHAQQFIATIAPMPFFVQNANLQRDICKVLAKELQLDGLLPSFAAIPDANVPLDPEVEWTMALQGLAPQISIADDDNKHIASHMQHLGEQQRLAADGQDEDAQMKMIAHVMQHRQQLEQKMAMMAQAAAQAAQASMDQGIAGLLGATDQGKAEAQTAGPVGQMLGGAMGGGGMGAADQAAGFPGMIGPTDTQGAM
jgi:hypothetical protein